jgi:hypothetical protein
MRGHFGWRADALQNTLAIAQRCRFQAPSTAQHFPAHALRQGDESESMVWQRIVAGILALVLGAFEYGCIECGSTSLYPRCCRVASASITEEDAVKSEAFAGSRNMAIGRILALGSHPDHEATDRGTSGMRGLDLHIYSASQDGSPAAWKLGCYV